MTKVRHIQFRDDKAGALIHGSIDVELAHFDVRLHMHRAVFLTAMLESPKWGTVQSYDGAAMSAGLIHNIAVAPRTMAQGSLFALLREIEVSIRPPDPFGMPGLNDHLEELWSALRDSGFYVAQDGKLRSFDTGSLVAGDDIRATFTPLDGNVPKIGPLWEQARRWALLFHRLFSDRSTFRAQIDFAAKWMAEGRSDLEMSIYRRYGVGGDSPIGVQAAALPADIDLAMSVYHSFSVNGPTPAARALERAWPMRDERFARALLHHLGSSDYGRWATHRYQATRRAALRMAREGERDPALGLWSVDLVQRLMGIP